MLSQIFGLRASEGYKIDGITSTFGLQQVINDPTDIIGGSSSCINLTFTSQPILVIESGVYSSLHPNCHHQITYSKFSLKMYYPLLINGKYDIMKKLTLITLEGQ